MVATHPAHAQTPTRGLFTEAAVPTQPRGAQARGADPAVAASVFARVDLSVLGGTGKPAAALDFEILRGLGATRFVARLRRTETQPSGRVAWIGTLDGVEFSSVTLIADATEGTLTGSITYPGAGFRITHTGGGLHDIQKIDPLAFPDRDDVAVHSAAPAATEASAELSATNADSAARIDVLMVYSPAARAAAGGAAAIQNLIDVEMAQANQAYANSGITTRTGTPVVQQWFTAGAACSATACSVAQAQALAVGKSYHWWIQTYNAAGYGPWSTNATFTVSGSTAGATVVSLWEVANTPVGGTATLWAQVQNTSVGLPSTARVWYYVSGPGWTGDNYVGSAGVADIAPGTTMWKGINWTIASGRTPGTYTYWARVFVGSEPISAWSAGQTFTVLAGNNAGAMTITMTHPPGTVIRGTTTPLWAKVRNAGTSIPVGATVYFWVTGPSGQGGWVGGATLTGLAPGTEQWFAFQWAVPTSLQTGTYTYWAQAWSSTAAISAWSAGQPFSIQ